MPICLKNIANLRMLPPDLISKLTPDLILKLPPALISKLPPDPTFKLPPGLPDDKTACVYVQGYYEPGDGGEGSFFWDDSSLAEEDSGIIFKPDLLDSSKKGRWKRIFNEPISVKWFGARGIGKSPDTDAIKNAIKAVKPGGQLIIPSGTYVVSSLHIDHAISLEGIGSSFEGIGRPKITSNDASSPDEIYAVIRFDYPSKDISGNIKINNLEVEYTGGKSLVMGSGLPAPVNGIFVTTNGRFECVDLEVHGSPYCGIIAKATSGIFLENVYSHDNGYAGANLIGSPEVVEADDVVVALPGCRFENNGKDPV